MYSSLSCEISSLKYSCFHLFEAESLPRYGYLLESQGCVGAGSSFLSFIVRSWLYMNKPADQEFSKLKKNYTSQAS